MEDKFLEQLKQIESKYKGDSEAIHSMADMVLCEALKELGYAELVKAYMGLEKWYA